MCCLSYPTKAQDYFRKDVELNSEKDLYDFYKRDSQAQADSLSERQNRTVKPYDFYTWLFRRGICPYGVINNNTKYWIELFSIYDGEMGLNTPLDYENLPSVFFEALRVYRENRPVEEPKADNNGK